MAVVLDGKTYKTLKDEMFVNGKKVYEVYVDGAKVYPEGVKIGSVIMVTLTWGQEPRDLDSHMTGNGWHVYYGRKKSGNGECSLDYDDVTSYGPEHTVLIPKGLGPYRFYVYHYAGDGNISSSGAKVYVQVDGAMTHVFSPPPGITGGVGSIWDVFQIIDGQIVPY